MKIKKLKENASSTLTLYRGYQKSKYRYDDIVKGFKNVPEVDFSDKIDVALGYGPCLIKIVIPNNLKFLNCVEFNEDIVNKVKSKEYRNKGFIGIKHFDQYYIYDIEKLNSSIIFKTAISNINGDCV